MHWVHMHARCVYNIERTFDELFKKCSGYELQNYFDVLNSRWINGSMRLAGHTLLTG